MSSYDHVAIGPSSQAHHDGHHEVRVRPAYGPGRPLPWEQRSRSASRRLTCVAVPLLLAACNSTEFKPPGLNEREVLALLYESTAGPQWRNQAGWLSTTAEVGTWYGVDTNSDGHVTRIEMERNFLAGPLPPELALLVHLERLNFRGNRLYGQIPPELGKLEGLEVLNLRENRLTGPIPPELGNLVNLDTLQLRDNLLSGPIPSELGGLPKLDFLSVAINELTGPIPLELLELDALSHLSLATNRLTGSIPPGLGSMRSLERVWLDFNELTGQVPSELGNLGSQLKWLDFRQNSGLEGPLPQELTNLTGLFRFEWGQTGLCAPDNEEFQRWLRSVPNRYGRGPNCRS